VLPTPTTAGLHIFDNTKMPPKKIESIDCGRTRLDHVQPRREAGLSSTAKSSMFARAIVDVKDEKGVDVQSRKNC